MSINGHFSHYNATPADAAAGDFFANQLLDPNAATDTAAYFRAGTSASLIYSVGCHSGLNVIDDAAPYSIWPGYFARGTTDRTYTWIAGTPAWPAARWRRAMRATIALSC
jgi:hypothetical protein